jgi:thiamine pyrophosphate-dependent acetolactate synthase large subunit-like protein
LRDGDEAANYGVDLADYVGAIGTDTAIAALPGIVRGELQKDDRVIQIDVDPPTVARSPSGLIEITLSISAYLTDELDPLGLTVAISDVGVSLLGVTA